MRMLFLLFSSCLQASVMANASDIALPYSKNIPTLYIETIDGTLNYVSQAKGNKVQATIMTIDTNGEVVYSGRCKLSGRGNSTWGWPKRPYNLKFERSADIINAKDSAMVWCLLANYKDDSQIRNALCYYTAREMDVPYTSNVYFVALYINDDYLGLYNLTTKQKYTADVETNVVAVFEKLVPDIYHNKVYDGTSRHDFVFRTRYGDTKEILKAIDAFEGALYNDSSTYDDLLEYADIESIARKNLVDLVTGNADVAISQYYMLDNCHRISAINAWDYDISYGIQPPKFDFSYNQIMSDHTWYNALFRYKEYRKVLFSLLLQNEKLLNEKTLSFEDSLCNAIKEDLQENANKWGIAGSDREQIDSFREKRLAFLKEYIKSPDEFRQIKFVHLSGREYTLCCPLNDTIVTSMLPEGMLAMSDEDFGGWFTPEGISINDIGVINHDMVFYEKSNGMGEDPFDNATLKYFLPIAVTLFSMFLLWLIVEGIIIPIKEEGV